MRVLIGASVIVVALGAALPAAGSPRAPRVLLAHGHAAFGDCPATAIEAQIAVASGGRSSPRGVTIRATVRDIGTGTCIFDGEMPSQGAQPIGPCGVLAVEVLNDHGTDVWPGRAAYNCPAEFSQSLVPGGSVEAVGSWNGVTPSGRPLPAGHYRLVVAQRFRFAVTVP